MGKVKLQLLTTTDDTKDNVVTYTSGDTANPTAFKDVAVLASNENHKSILNKISTMFNNVRYLYKILGNTDISALGSVTQAIATLNGNVGSMKGISSSAAITTQGQYALDAREKNASVDGTLANEIIKLNSNLPKCYVINVSKVSQNFDSDEVEFGIYNTYAVLEPDYSPLNGKNILATILTHVGIDSTDFGAVTSKVFISDVSSADGKTINQIRVFSYVNRTVRAKILVLYTD